MGQESDAVHVSLLFSPPPTQHPHSSVVIWHLLFDSARTEYPIRDDTETERTVRSTGLKSGARPSERTITLPVVHATAGDPATESVTGHGSVSTAAGNAGPGLVAVPPR